MISFLRNLRLTLEQYLLITAAAVIGVLVIILDLKTSKLHKVQVDLLKANFGRSMDQQDAKVDAAKEKFEKAYNEYQKGVN